MDIRKEINRLEGFSPEDKNEKEHLIEDSDAMLKLLLKNGAIEEYEIKQNGSIFIKVNEELDWDDTSFENKMQGLRQTHSFILGMYTFMMAMAHRAEKAAADFEKKLKEQQAKAPRILVPQTIPLSDKQKKLIL